MLSAEVALDLETEASRMNLLPTLPTHICNRRRLWIISGVGWGRPEASWLGHFVSSSCGSHKATYLPGALISLEAGLASRLVPTHRREPQRDESLSLSLSASTSPVLTAI